MGPALPQRHAAQILALTVAVNATLAAPYSSLAQTSDVPANDTGALTRQLYDINTKADQREQSAQRLLTRPDPGARDVISRALNDYSQPAVQIAAVKALAASPTADPTLVNSLFALLDPYNDRSIVDFAGAALTAYKDSPDVLNRLISKFSDPDERVRVAVIKAAGTYIDKKVAKALIPMLASTEPPAVVNAATQALAYLTGLSASTDWRAWWQTHGDQSDSVFQAELVRGRAARFDEVARRRNELESELSRLLTEAYSKTPRGEQRTEVLLRYLRSSEASARAVGCRIALDGAQSDVTPDPVKQQLRQLIGDAAPDVRRNAALAIALINDADSVVPLLVQLNQETDTTVRAAIVSALKPTRDPRAVPTLMKLLDDPSADTVQQVADALGELAVRIRETDPALAESAAEKLAAVMAARTKPQDNIDLRTSLVKALAPLKSSNRRVQATLKTMLDSASEDRKVRREVLGAVGQYKNPEFADSIAAWTSDQNDLATRLIALRALGDSADNLGAFDKRLKDLIDPAKEPQQEVRDAAWKVLTILFAKAPLGQLGNFELTLKDRPDKLLVVLKEERSRFVTSGDAKSAAEKSQQIGDACRNAKLYADAIAAYTDALNYAAANGKTTEIICEGLLDAFLKNRNYPEGIQFAQQQIAQNNGFEGTAGPVIRSEADRLVNETKDFDAGVQLIDLALNMTPKLSPKYRDALQQLQSQVKNRGNQRNETPYPPNDPTQTAMAW
ncbi:MAG: hypothetical protein JWM57_3973 [Phycisphaerales bacterium]|nr:hypothetical protein [Phycisphaerales bacterium]